MGQNIGHNIRQTVEDIFQTVCELPPAERAAYLDRACSGDKALRREIEELLRFHESHETFLEKPALQDAARRMANQVVASSNQKKILPDTLREGDWMFGPYRIFDQLGKGGMGVVYLAEDTRDGKWVAIKVLPKDIDLDEDRLARFNREGRMLEELKSLKHPNIAEIYEQAEYDGKPCIALEYVPGDTLADRLRCGPLPIPEALRIALQIADALESAHQRRIVHRDLKPANIKITPDGQVKVLDFGLAKRFRDDAETGESRTRSMSLTESGMLIGTPAYMSPEQWNGEEIDQRADLWAFGCLLYEMLTGEAPFDGKSRAETMKSVLDANPDWQALPEGTPIIIQDLIRRCLRREAGLRLQDAGEARRTVAEAIAKNRLAPLLFVKSQIWRVKRHARAIALTAFLIVCATAGVWYWLKLTEIPSQKYVVVLPFNGFEMEQAGRGFADELRRNLIRASNDLHVIQPAEISRNHLSSAGMQMIPRDFGATLIVGGDVERSGDKIQISYWVRNSNIYRVAGGKLDGDSRRIADLQNRLAEEITQVLNVSKPQRSRASASHYSLKHPNAAEEYLSMIGELQSDLNKDSVEKLIQRIERLIESEGASARLQAALAYAYFLQADMINEPELARKAMIACEQALRLDPTAPEAQVTRGLALTFLGDYAGAIKGFGAVLSQHPNDLEAMLGLAVAYEYAEKPQDAEKTYRQAIKVWPGYWGSHNELGAFYFSQGRYEDALTEWNSVIRLIPNKPSGYINIGNAYFKLGQYEKAKESYRGSIGKGGEATEEFYLGLGAAQFYLGEYRLAVDTFKAGIARFPQSPQLWTSLGDAQRQIMGEEAEAIRSYDQAINIGQVDRAGGEVGIARQAERYAKRSKVKAAVGDGQDAANDKQKSLLLIRRALDRAPEDVEALASAVVVYHLAGDQEKALLCVEQSLKQGHSLIELEQNPELEALRKEPRYQQIAGQVRQRKSL